jgi:S-adenosylmethionine:tRNA ribosyltransferase-isomerase
LHFTKSLLDKIKKKGAEIVFITLHIGGSVLPLTVKDFRNFKMYKEYFEVNAEAKQKINQAKKRGGKVIGVGTTVVRALETAAGEDGTVNARRCWTNLTIKPPYNFKVIDGFLTNFHLPGSSHLILTCAFGGVEAVLSAYKEAIKMGYKFLDFGDGMLIL